LTIPLSRFDRVKCAEGLEGLRQYRAEYDEERKVFKPTPLHDWASNPADAYRYLAVGWRAIKAAEPPAKSTVDFFIGTPEGAITSNLSIKEMIERQSARRKEREGA
jgi:hypothetical protein